MIGNSEIVTLLIDSGANLDIQTNVIDILILI